MDALAQVLEVTVKRRPKGHFRVQQLVGKLSLVDLAGSERAAETNNAGQKLRDGARAAPSHPRCRCSSWHPASPWGA
jgi:hypothetical protein